jgi:glycerophosphoryl diester phosphodiesterase
VQVIAHRGASYYAPENTVTSAKLAWEMGSEAVELDLFLTSDKKLVCIHDSNTERTGGVNLNINNTTFETLRKLDVGSFKSKKYAGEKIPTFEEMIAATPEGKELVVELKNGSVLLPYLPAVISENLKKQKISFICFDLETIKAAKKIFPDYRCYWLCSNPELLLQNLNDVATSKLNGVSLNYKIINQAVADQIKALGLDLYAYTVNDINEAYRLQALGVKGITTDRPDILLKDALFNKKKGLFTDLRDGKNYATISIGNQIWMAENLSFNLNTGSYAYNDDEQLVNLYGRLYTQDGALKACPTGWHLPTVEEWQIMINNLGGDNLAGSRMKSTKLWANPNSDANNISAFNALPAGSKYHSDGSYNNMGDHALFWSGTIFDQNTGWFFYVNHDRTKSYQNRLRKTSGFSVRCVKDLNSQIH